ncbi:hypothetical protein T459_30395 [Capsicum annuum]|uniref:Uncharacterized protein n=1 Tax=Capsicum annuum TaxID=4072 RepID=A0A2G2Y8A5_CAPAN|nr:hypothetical protein T459_30395 [Capsicum annuum]
MESNNSLEQTLQDGKLYRHVNALIVAHLRDNNLNQRPQDTSASIRSCFMTLRSLSMASVATWAASAVASATMTPMNVEARPNKLLELVAKGLAVEKEETVRGGVSTAVPFDPIITGYGSIPTPRAASVDFRQFISHHTFFLTS